ncbi:MAG TPA: hypothetical protein VGH79_08815 [Gaiellaceae bacterium]|jgi:hypothetical protein
MSSIMKDELERLARVAVGYGRDDPAVDVFLVFVGALDPLPDAATLKPAARVVGKLRLARSLDRPGESRLGACRLLAAALAAPPRGEVVRREDEPPAAPVVAPTSAGAGRSEVRATGTATAERPVRTERRVPELVDALVHAIRSALSIFA